MSRLVLRVYEAVERIHCRACHDTIEPGQMGVVFLYDGNESGTGPSEHRAHHPDLQGTTRGIYPAYPPCPNCGHEAHFTRTSCRFPCGCEYNRKDRLADEIAERDPFDTYGTEEHEWLLMQEERGNSPF